MTDYPQEILFLELVHEWDRHLTIEQKEWIQRRVFQALGKWVMSNQDRSEFGGSVSMKISDCVKKNKRVILLI
jgi:hypothetical protein